MTSDFQNSEFGHKIIYKFLKEKIPKIEKMKNELGQNLFLQNCILNDSKQTPKIHHHPKIISLASETYFHFH